MKRLNDPRGLNFLSNSKVIQVIVFSTIIAILVDASITKIYYINFNQILSIEPKIQIFFFVGILCFVNQYFLLNYLRRKTSQQILKKQISPVYNATYYSQIIFFAVFLILFFEIFFNESYHSILLVFLTGGVSVLASLVMAILGKALLRWYKIEKNVVLFLYALSFISLSLNIIFSSVMAITFLLNKPEIIYFHYGIVSPHYHLNIINILEMGNSISSICGFTLAWVSTILMLNQYSIRWKSKIHWLIVSIPMIYFLIQFHPLLLEGILNIMKLSTISYAIFYTLFVSYSQAVGGIIFGSAFWTLTKVLANKGINFEFPRIAGYGFILLFMSNQILLISPASYPPFGLVTISMLPLACFMLFVGIHSSALTASFDMKIKNTIKDLVKKRSNLLSSMSSSEAILSLEKRMAEIYNQVSKESEDVGANTMLSIEEAKNYLNNELEDMKKDMKKE